MFDLEVQFEKISVVVGVSDPSSEVGVLKSSRAEFTNSYAEAR